jgi:lycopene beta-cyclase
MRILDSHRSVRVSCGDTPYQMIAAESFYTQALAVIDHSPHIDLVLGLPVLGAPAKRGRHWHVETGLGLKRALTVVDTRPRQKPQRGGAVLWQSFSGHEVNCAEPVFDPGCVDLMDFSHRDPAGISFHYVLPLSTHRALIEVARFAVQPFGPEHLASDLTQATRHRVRGAPFTIVRSESGVLPMGSSPPGTLPTTPRDPSYVYAGLAGGGARPSTGYAFQRIQCWADSCAQLISGGKSPAGHPGDPLLLRAMDHIFLSVLRTQPEAAPAVFLSLFERADTARVIRFLSDRGTLADYLAIIAALPFGPFLRELPRGLMSMAGRAPA